MDAVEVKAIRQSLNLTQVEFSKLILCSSQLVALMEQGRTPVSPRSEMIISSVVKGYESAQEPDTTHRKERQK